MSIDINKIILESIQDEAASSDDTVLEENALLYESDSNENDTENIDTPSVDTNYCVASAISAGLGAMTFRNHLRSLNEISDKTKSRLKTAGKIGAGALGAAGVAGLAYRKMQGKDDLGSVQAAAKKVMGKFTSGDKESRSTNPASQGFKSNPGQVSNKLTGKGNDGGLSDSRSLASKLKSNAPSNAPDTDRHTSGKNTNTVFKSNAPDTDRHISGKNTNTVFKSNAPDTDRHVPSNTERNLNPGKKLISGTNARGNRTGRPADTSIPTGKKLISGSNTLGNRTGRGQKTLSLGSGDNRPGNRTGQGQQSDGKYLFIRGKRGVVKGLNVLHDKFTKKEKD